MTGEKTLEEMLSFELAECIQKAIAGAGHATNLGTVVVRCLGHRNLLALVGPERAAAASKQLSQLNLGPLTQDAFVPLICELASTFHKKTGANRAATPADFLAGVLYSKNHPSPEVQAVRQVLLAIGLLLDELLLGKSSGYLYEPLGYGEDLNSIMGTVPECPVIGMEDLLERFAVRLRYNSVCLIGEPGVGKSAVVRGLVWHVTHGSSFIVESMRHWRFVALSRSDLLAGTGDRGDFEERLKGLLEHLRLNPHVRVFFDEVHSLLDAHEKTSAQIINALKPAMADPRNPLRFIAATTDREYERHIMPDEALHSRFSPTLLVPEASEAATEQILKRTAPSLIPRAAAERGLAVGEDLFRFMIELSGKYQRLDCFPRKAVRLLRETIEQKAYRMERYPGEAAFVDREFILETARQSWGVNVSREEPGFWQGLHQELRVAAPSQYAAAEALAAFFLRASRRQVAPRPAGTPAARMVLIQPDHRSQLSLARLLSVLRQRLFGDDKAGEREDFREFSTELSRTRLVGAPPAYAGFGESRTIFAKIRARPQGGVLMLANYEYTHPSLEPDILALLQGTARDSAGRPVDASHWVVVLTATGSADVLTFSNEGRNDIAGLSSNGFTPAVLEQMDLVLPLAVEAESSEAPLHALLLEWEERGVQLPTAIKENLPALEHVMTTQGLSPERVLENYLQLHAQEEIRESPSLVQP